MRIPYRNADLLASGAAQVVVTSLSATSGGHTTRDIVFSKHGTRMFISVGSASNVGEQIGRKTAEQVAEWEAEHGLGAAWGPETGRANIVVTDPEGSQPLRPYATGIRNPVGLAVHPTTGDLWVSVNERDLLGDNLTHFISETTAIRGYRRRKWTEVPDDHSLPCRIDTGCQLQRGSLHRYGQLGFHSRDRFDF